MTTRDLETGRPGLNPLIMVGAARMHRVGVWSFPVHRLVQDGETLAALGRGSWLTVNLGRGQRIELRGGARWTLRSIGLGGTFTPMLVDEVGRRVATAGVSHGTYGINLRDTACVLVPADDAHGPGRANRWILRRHEQELAVLTRYPTQVQARYPTHLGAVLMAFELIRHGLAEESMPRIPAFRWHR